MHCCCRKTCFGTFLEDELHQRDDLVSSLRFYYSVDYFNHDNSCNQAIQIFMEHDTGSSFWLDSGRSPASSLVTERSKMPYHNDVIDGGGWVPGWTQNIQKINEGLWFGP